MITVGTRVGPYEIAAILGQGGMGVVYKALDTRNGSTVALKSLPRADPSALYRFKQEFRSLADISHPNLASLYELISLDGAWWLAMEFVDGVDLLSYVHGVARSATPAATSDDAETSETPVPRDDPGADVDPASAGGRASGPFAQVAPGAAAISPEQVGRLRSSLAQLAGALDALHASDTLHRDIKPSNVMVDATGRTVLLDFGLATAMSTPDAPQGQAEFVGTVDYMAPEQAASHALSPAADWYAVGVMLFRALAGRLPFEGSPWRVLDQKQTGSPPSLGDIIPTAPADLRDLCEALLCRDPSERPSGREVLARLGVQESRERLRVEELLVGRDAQVQTLRDALARVRAGHPAVVFVRGRSGAGKSHLVRHFLAEARAVPDAAVLSGRCYEDESVPYKTVDSLIDALAQFLVNLPPPEREVLAPRDAPALTRVFPVLRQVAELTAGHRTDMAVPDPQELRRRAFRGLRELLGRIGDRRPLVVYVDDLQWGDADGAALLADLLRPPDAPALLLLCAYRSEYAEVSACVRALRQAYGAGPDIDATTIDVEPLGPAEALALAQALLQPAAPDRAARAASIAQESGGVPFFIHELARHQAGSVSGEPADAGADLDRLIRRRVAGLAPSAREVLEVVAVCGQPITRLALAAASGSADRGVLRLLRTAHFVRTTGAGDDDWVEPYHDRIREAVVNELPAGRARAHHQRLADSLEAAGGTDPETLASHFEGAGVRDRAGHYYAEAAAAAADQLAFARASTLYTRALALQTLTDEDARRLRVRLADALANDGRGADAAREYLAATTGATAGEAVDLRRKAAYQYCISGHLAEGRAALRSLLGPLGITMADRRPAVITRLLLQRGRLRLRGLNFTATPAAAAAPADLLRSDLTWAAGAGLSMFDILAGAEFVSRNLYDALGVGEPSRVVRALAWEAAHTSNAGSGAWPRTARLLERARAIARDIDQPHAQAMVAMASGVAEFTMGRWTSARDRLLEAEEALRSRCTGVAWELDTTHTFELWARIYSGDVGAMAERTAQLLDEASKRGDLYATTNFGSFMVPHARLAEDDAEGAERAVDEALRLWGIEGYHLQHLTGLMSRVYIDLYRGDGPSALERLTSKRGWVRAGFFTTIQVLRVVLASLEGRAALMAAQGSPDRGRLLGLVRARARTIEREDVAWARPIARLLRAGLALADRQRDEAVLLLEQAAAEFDAVPMDGYAAAARWRAAGLLDGSGRAAGLRERAGEWMTHASIRSPERMARMLAFGESR